MDIIVYLQYVAINYRSNAVFFGMEIHQGDKFNAEPPLGPSLVVHVEMGSIDLHIMFFQLICFWCSAHQYP